MTDVFISYTRQDRPAARRLAKLIAERGYKVWWDVELLPGDNFADEINAILNQAKAVVVLWTPESVESAWVKSEAAIAFDRGVLIPARLKDTAIPAPYNALQTLDLTSWDHEADDHHLLAPLLEAIERRVDAESVSQEPLSQSDVEEALEKPKYEVEFWTSIAQSSTQSSAEYRLYLDRYGEDAAFADLARRRIADLSSQRPRRKMSRILVPLGVAVGIVVGLFVFSEKIGLLMGGPCGDGELMITGEGSPSFASKSTVEGRYGLSENFLHLCVTKAALRLSTSSGYNGPRNLRTLRAGIACPMESGGKWEVVRYSQEHTIGETLLPEDTTVLTDLDFSLPIASIPDLHRCWIVFETEEDVEGRIGTSYIFSDRDFFRQ